MSSSTLHAVTNSQLISWAAVGVTTAIVLYPLVRHVVQTIRTRVRPLPYPVCDNAAAATRLALTYIRAGRIRTVGELVHMLRGPPHGMCTTETKPRRNAFFLRLPLEYLLFLQESYLPATYIKPAITATTTGAAARKVSAASSPASQTTSTGSHQTADHAHTTSAATVAAMTKASTDDVHGTTERHMFSQLLQVSNTLRGLEVQRATAWSSDNVTHANLLQQLWAASGRSPATFARTGPAWSELGFQGEDPVTDIRGGGMLGLRQLVHFAQSYPEVWQDMMAYNARVQGAQEHAWYLPAVVSFQLTTHLALQREWELSVGHLQVVYDTIVIDEDATAAELVSKGEILAPHASYTAAMMHATDAGSTSARAASAGQPVRRQLISRTALARAMGNVSLARTSSLATADFWKRYVSDGEAGFHLLHHMLLLHFKRCWERDKPHVMEFNNYVATHVYATFFTPSWTQRS